jgi:hypothetical protein
MISASMLPFVEIVTLPTVTGSENLRGPALPGLK